MANLELVPVHTRILTHRDDIVEAIMHYAGKDIGPEDIVCVAESVVAITQGRITRPEELRPTWQARLLCRFVPAEGSMSSVYGMQSAMELDGKWKVFGALFWGPSLKYSAKTAFFTKFPVRLHLRMTLRGQCRRSINTLCMVRKTRIKWRNALYNAPAVTVP